MEDNRIRIILNEKDKSKLISILKERNPVMKEERELTELIINKLENTKTINIFWFDKFKKITQIDLLKDIKYKIHHSPIHF